MSSEDGRDNKNIELATKVYTYTHFCYYLVGSYVLGSGRGRVGNDPSKLRIISACTCFINFSSASFSAKLPPV